MDFVNPLLTGGHSDCCLLAKDGMILKKILSNKGEVEFYEDFISEDSDYVEENRILKKFFPKYYGKEIVGEEAYMKLDNLMHPMENCSYMDLKIGSKVIYESALGWGPERLKCQSQKKKELLLMNIILE